MQKEDEHSIDSTDAAGRLRSHSVRAPNCSITSFKCGACRRCQTVDSTVGPYAITTTGAVPSGDHLSGSAAGVGSIPKTAVDADDRKRRTIISMARKKKSHQAPRRKRMTRDRQLSAARATRWVEQCKGKDIVAGYANWFAVDPPCAVIELRMLGVTIDAERESRIRAAIEAQTAERKPRQELRAPAQLEEIPFDRTIPLSSSPDTRPAVHRMASPSRNLAASRPITMTRMPKSNRQSHRRPVTLAVAQESCSGGAP